jgi:DNA-binding transcriptional LysR family regulator
VLANLEVKWLYDVIALEESRSFTLAAKARNISQSSFSRRIQSLEAPSDSASSIVAPTLCS